MNGSVALTTALRLPLVLPSASHGLRMLIGAAGLSIGTHVDPVIEIDSYRAIKQLVARGTMFGMLPMAAIRDEVGNGSLKAWRLRHPALKRRVMLAYRADRPLSSASWAIARLAWSVLNGIVASGAWLADWTGADTLPDTQAA